MTKEHIAELADDLKNIIIYKNVIKDETVDKAIKILNLLASEKMDERKVYELYSDLFSDLSNYAVENNVYSQIWKSKIDELVRVDENIFSMLSEKFGRGLIDETLKMTAKKELQCLKNFSELDFAEFIKEYLPFNAISWEHLIALSKDDKQYLLDCDNADDVVEYYEKNGCGIYGMYRAFRWHDGKIVAVENPDPVEFEDLVGYEDEHRIVIDNTERFLRGLPASNILLYGDRGTGKSSTVKAVLNMYYKRCLRLIEVNRQDLLDLSKIISVISKRGLKFILFLDDLSFEENETEYKILKSTLEGGIEKLPANVVIYATSNRRHMIKEYLTDNVQNEIHSLDTKEEKLSLADRFGITITFTSPDQEEYLKIVKSLARKYQIDLDEDTLKSESIRWSSWHNGMSPRTARQFIDHLRSC
ncbi:MAG: ATP-binding protein [Thermoanaerobacterium sp.]|nr:ATP-binding protein [Thermoanaerobacterium sp.]